MDKNNTINWTAKLLSDCLHVNSFKAIFWEDVGSVFVKNKDIGKILVKDLSVEQIEDETIYDNLGIFDSKGFLMGIYWGDELDAKQVFGIEKQIMKRTPNGCQCLISFFPIDGSKARIVVLY